MFVLLKCLAQLCYCKRDFSLTREKSKVVAVVIDSYTPETFH